MKSTKILTALAITDLLAFCTAFALAREISGSFLRTIRDPSGAPIPGAKVTITDAEKKIVVRTVLTNDEGQFSAPLIPVGLYDIEAEAQGFKKPLALGVKLDLNQRRAVDLALEVGNITETVTVVATGNPMESSMPLSSSLISGD